MRRKNVKIEIEAELIHEGPWIVAHAKALDVSSCGKTVDEAVRALAEAVGLFLKTCQDMGTFSQVLAESGYTLEDEKWTVRDHEQNMQVWEPASPADSTRRFACVEI
jgi:predicted RNase H-like HicB family nuclease